ncbi:MAG: hypothetical protein K1Y36_06340 [Blastocatellia bacterium]|nr:hypothetical protein [Blastocatellia bacterium]
MDPNTQVSKGRKSLFQIFTLTIALLLAGWWFPFETSHLATDPAQDIQTRNFQPNAIFIVTNTGDNGGINPAVGAGTGTLRQAIIDANANSGSDVIDASGITGTISLQATLPTIAQPLTVNGPTVGTLAVTRGTAASFGIFTIGSNASTTLNRLVITNGSASQGAGVNSGVGSDLTLNQCTLSGHVGSSHHGALQFAGGVGRTLTIDSCTIASNTSIGAAIGTNDAGGEIVILRNSTFNNNTSTSFNGGAYDPGPNLTLTITNCTFSGNTSAAMGGALRFQSTFSGTATLTNCTITGNRAHLAGGGLSRAGTGVLILTNTNVAGNFRNPAPSLTADDVDGVSFASTSANNLIGVNTGLTGISNGVNGNLVGTAANPINPLLGPLANNGGPTQTHALLNGSPAIHAGTPNGAPAADQRGVARDANPDIGAYEATVVTIFRGAGQIQCPGSTLSWTVGFQNPTAGLTAANFNLVSSGGLGGVPVILNVTPNSPPPTTAWTVMATSGSGEGMLGLNLMTSAGLTPAPPDVLPVTGQAYNLLASTAIGPATLPNGAVGTAYSQTLTAQGGSGTTFTFAIIGGAVPNGFNLAPAGVLSGTPSVSGTFNFTVGATGGGCSGSRTYTITIARLVNSSASVTVTGTNFNLTPSTGFIGDFTLDTVVQNTGAGVLNGPLFFQVTRLQPVGQAYVYRMKTADDFVAGGPTGGLVGSRQTLGVGTLTPGATTPVSFTIGVATARVQFQFQVDLYSSDGTSIQPVKVGSLNLTISQSLGPKGSSFGTKLDVDPAAAGETALISGAGVQTSPVLAIHPTNPEQIAVAVEDYAARSIVVRVSDNGGTSWREQRLSRNVNGREFFAANAPALAFTPQGELLVAYTLGNLEDSTNALVVSRMGDRLTFSPLVSLAEFASAQQKFVARPSLAVSSTGLPFVAWETVDTVNNRSSITVARATGTSLIQNTVAQGAVSHPTLVFGGRDVLYLGWQEGAVKSSAVGGGVSIAVGDINGAFGAPQQIAPTGIGYGRIIPAMPEEEVTANLSLVPDPLQPGTLTAVFTVAGDGLDVVWARSTDNGKTWSGPRPVSDVTAGDQFHGVADTDGKGNLSIAYRDTRHSFGNETVLVRLAKTSDGGQTFTHAQVTTVPSNDSRSNPGRDTNSNLGTRIGVKVGNGLSYVVWTDTRLGNEDIYLANPK